MPTEAAPVAPAPVTAPAASAAAAPSPKSPVPPVGSSAAHLAAARSVFAPDPARTPPAAEPKTEPAPAAKTEPAKVEPAKATEPAKADAPAEFPEDKLPEPATEAAKAGWKELKAMTKAERNRATIAEARIKELEAKQATSAPVAADTAELERLRTEHKALSDRLLTLDLQNHPDFHKQYVAPKKAALETAKEVIGYNGKEAGALDALLTKPLKDFNAAVSELTDKMNPADAMTVMQSLRQARDIAGQEAAALAKAGDVHQQLQQKTAQMQRQAFEAVSKEITLPKMEVKPDATPEERAAADAYNQSIESLRPEAEKMAFGKITEHDVAKMAHNNALLGHMTRHVIPGLQKRDQAQTQIIADLTAQLKALQGGKAPSPSGGAPAQAAPQNESIEQMARRAWGKA